MAASLVGNMKENSLMMRMSSFSQMGTRVILIVCLVASGLVLIWAALSLPQDSTGLALDVERRLPDSGVSNPVTAVLLNFRGYDTLLEVGVLLLAVVAIWSLRIDPNRTTLERFIAETPVLAYLVRLLVPVMLLVAGYLTWVGSFRAGGAFQGGAVVAGAGVLLLLAAMVQIPRHRRLLLRSILVVGFGLFLAVAIGMLLLGNHLLEYPPDQAYLLILLIEAVLTISIGLTLTLLFLGIIPEVAAIRQRQEDEA